MTACFFKTEAIFFVGGDSKFKPSFIVDQRKRFMRNHGPWKIKATEDVYQDPFIHVWKDEVVGPDGIDGQHVVVAMKPGVCVLAVDDQYNLHLTNEFHYGVGRYSIEAVSGGIEPGEDADVTAVRELQEELGLAAGRWNYLSTVDPFTTIMVSPTRLYFAHELTEVESQMEGTETIEKIVLPLETAWQKVVSGEITHAPTCVLISRAKIEFSKF